MVTSMVPKLPYFETRGDFHSLCCIAKIDKPTKTQVINEYYLLWFPNDINKNAHKPTNPGRGFNSSSSVWFCVHKNWEVKVIKLKKQKINLYMAL